MSSPHATHTPAAVPDEVAHIGELMDGYPAPWALCGGWAVDAWLGKLTREHGDIDIAVFQDDLPVLFKHLSGWQMVAHDDSVAGNTSALWNGRKIDIPGHIHARSPGADDTVPAELDEPGKQGFGLDIQICERSAGDWMLHRDPDIALQLADAIAQSPSGLPCAVPEVLLYYKAQEMRMRDKLDFASLLPQLSDHQRSWLRNALMLTGHPWLPRLSG